MHFNTGAYFAVLRYTLIERSIASALSPLPRFPAPTPRRPHRFIAFPLDNMSDEGAGKRAIGSLVAGIVFGSAWWLFVDGWCVFTMAAQQPETVGKLWIVPS